jgi:hypothetical protein
MRSALPDEAYIKLFKTKGPEFIHKNYGLARATIYRRRNALEIATNQSIYPPSSSRKKEYRADFSPADLPHRHHLDIANGVVICASDFHYWPSKKPSAGHRAVIWACKEFGPKAFIANGDVHDFPSISRWSPTSWADWEKRPSVQSEIEYTQERMYEIEQATPRGCKLVWPIGNHDERFEKIIAEHVPQLAKVEGIHLKDHYPSWTPCMACWVNCDVVYKHEYAGGIHAIYNNVLKSGMNIFTGHLHALNLRRFCDYRGSEKSLHGRPRWGGDCGMIADPYGPQFLYDGDKPKDWAAGFMIHTYEDGQLRWPEIVHIVDENHAEFRGKLIKV